MTDSTERRTVLEGLAATVMGVSALSAGTASAADPLGQASVPGQSPAQQMFGDVAPKLAELTDKVLFGDVWERPGLSKAFYSGWPTAVSAVLVAKDVFKEAK